MTFTCRLYGDDGDVFTPEAAANLTDTPTKFRGRPARIVSAEFDPENPEYVTVTIDPRCPGCYGLGYLPRADYFVMGGQREPDYRIDPVVRTHPCPTCWIATKLVTVECGKPGARYGLIGSPGARYVVHLAGNSARGGTGPILCGYDRFRGPDGKPRGFSIGGGVSGGPDYPASHAACEACADRIDGRPVRGIHAGLFQ